MEQDKEWLKIVSGRLRNAEVAPPESGWDRLEKALSAPAAPVKSPRWRIYVARAAAVAAVLAAGVLSVEYLWQRDPVLQQQAQQQLTTAAQVDPSEAVPQIGTAQAEQPLLAQSVARPESHRKVSVEVVSQQVVPTNEESESAVEPQSDPQPQATPTTRSSRSGQPATRQVRTAYPDEVEFESAKPRRRTSLGVFGGGSVTSGSSAQPGVHNMMLDGVADSDQPGVDAPFVPKQPRDDYRESSFRHHQPLSFGLSVRKELRYGLSLESGVNYTLLRSDVRRPFATEDTSQKLHFIGIPLRLNWQCFEQGAFSLYIGAGGMVEKCVSAKLGSKAMNEPGVQWSLNAAVGAQYRLGGHVGLYFEPEAAYYLTETRLRTARTEAPLSLSLRLGVRVLF